MPFELRTFGGLALVGEGLPSTSGQRRRLALLVLLARGPDGRVSRDKLLAWLWPESTDAKARHGLDQLLYATRRDLGREAIATADGQVRLVGEMVRADCAVFERLLEAGELARACELYTGPFLDGFHLGDAPEFERWVEEQRALLAARHAGALERLAREAQDRGDLIRAAEWWRQRAAAEPLDGRVARCAVEAIAAAGDRPGALRHARAHTRLVEEELGLPPDAGLLALAELLAGEVGPAQAARARLLAAPAGASPAAGSGTAAAGQTGPGEPVGADDPERPHRERPRRARFGFAGASLAALALATLVLQSGDGGSGAALQARLPEPAGAGPARRPGTADAAAEAFYLRARAEWNDRTRESLERSVVLFRRAIERDPTYAEAYAGLADAYVLLGYHGFLPGDASFPKGRAAARQALALDPDMGEAYAALGTALQWERRWTEAEQAFRQSLRLAPEYATGHQWYALLLTILGRNEEAVIHGRHAAELDPLSLQVHNTYGVMLLNVGALDSALHVYERIVTYEPDSAWVRRNPWVLDNFGSVAAAAGRHAEATRLLERAAAAVPGHPRPLFHLAAAHIDRGDRRSAEQTFARADSTHGYYPIYRAMLHARLGELDTAFQWLDRVQEWGLPALNVLVNQPRLDALRADPRYATLRRRLDLP